MLDSNYPTSLCIASPSLQYRYLWTFLLGALLVICFGRSVSAQELPDAPEVTGTISGEVVDEQNEALPGIEVTAFFRDQSDPGDPFWRRHKSVITDEEGNFQIGLLVTGVYRLEMSDPAGTYLSVYYGQTTSFFEATEVAIAGNDVEGINVILSKGGIIAGAVTDSSGTALPNIAVDVYLRTSYEWQLSQEIQTDESGRYEIRTLKPGNYALGFSARQLDEFGNELSGAYADENYDDVYSLSNVTELEIVTGTAIVDLETQLARYGSIEGSIDVSGTIDAEITIILYSDHDNFQKEADRNLLYAYGNDSVQYSFANLRPGIYRVSASAWVWDYNYYNRLHYFEYYSDTLAFDASVPIQVNDGETTSGINFFLDKLSPDATLEGTVRNSKNDPIPDIEIIVSEPCPPWEDEYYCDTYAREFARATTDVDGRYLVSHLDPRGYIVSYTDLNQTGSTAIIPKPIHYVEQVANVRLDPGANVFDVTLELGGAVAAKASTWDERTLDDVTASLYELRDTFWVLDESQRFSRYGYPYDTDPNDTENGVVFTFPVSPSSIYRMGIEGYQNGMSFRSFYADASEIETATNITGSAGMISADINFTIGEDIANASIGGAVTRNGIAQPGIQVDLYHRQSERSINWPLLVYTTSNLPGDYFFAGLRAGEYRLRFSEPGTDRNPVFYGDASSLDNAQTVELLSDSDTYTADMELPSVSGTRVEEESRIYTPLHMR